MTRTVVFTGALISQSFGYFENLNPTTIVAWGPLWSVPDSNGVPIDVSAAL